MLPDPQDEVQRREVFGDFVLDALTPIGQLCVFYNLPHPVDSEQTLGHWLEGALHRPPMVGDSAMPGRAELSVRQVDEPHIEQVGIKLS